MYDKIFTRVETAPSLKISNEIFEDTLTSFLKIKDALFNGDKIRFKFIVTVNSQIFDLVKDSGESIKEAIVKDAILNFYDFWLPAKQHGRPVCAYAPPVIDIIDDILHIGITH